MRDLIKKWAEVHSDSIALKTPKSAYTWAELEINICQIAGQLQNQGITENSIVAAVSKNETDLLFLYLACLRLNVLCAFMPIQNLSAIKPKLAICGAQFIWFGKGCEALQSVQLPQKTIKISTDLSVKTEVYNALSNVNYKFNQASIVFTSGSTGTPKAVVHLAKQHIASAEGLTERFHFEANDSWLLSLPMYHISGLAIIWRWLVKGATLVIGNGDLLQDIQQVTHASLVPIQLQKIVNSGIKTSLKRVLLGGGQIPTPLTAQATRQGIESWVGYGMTETASTVIAKQVDGSPTSGSLLPLRQLKLENGRIFVAGQTLAAGYLADGKLTPLVTRQQPWFDTKDLGVLSKREHQAIASDINKNELYDNGDEIQIIGRVDNLFTSAGVNIHCEEIEAALLKHEDIKQAIVIPVDDNKYGQRPVAFIQTKCLLSRAEYQQFLITHLDKFKCPDSYFLLPESLLNSGIKIPRTQLKAHYQQINALNM